jgi:hypothetical protein
LDTALYKTHLVEINAWGSFETKEGKGQVRIEQNRYNFDEMYSFDIQCTRGW